MSKAICFTVSLVTLIFGSALIAVVIVAALKAAGLPSPQDFGITGLAHAIIGNILLALAALAMLAAAASICHAAQS